MTALPLFSGQLRRGQSTGRKPDDKSAGSRRAALTRT